jgi:tetratricopeptide (TPR) repeat protein
VAVDREKVIQAALRFAEKKRYPQAIAEYQKILQEDPNDPRLLLKVGDLQHKGEMYQAAVDTYERVAKHYSAQGFALKAIAVYKQIRDLITRHVPQLEDRYQHILPRLGELYQQLGLVSDALATYDEVATKLQRAGRDHEAVAVFHKIVELDQSNPLPHLRLAEALTKSKDIEGSIDQFSQAADILLGLGKRDGAMKVLERLLQIRPDAKFAKRAAAMFLDRGEPNDGMLALAKLQIAFQANQKDLETLGLLARAFEQIGQRPKAIEVRKETARLAREAGDQAVFQQEMEYLLRVAPHDEQVRAMAKTGPSEAPKPPDDDVVEIDEIDEIEAIDDGAIELSEDDGFDGPGPAMSRREVHVPNSMRAAEEVSSAYTDVEDPLEFTQEQLTLASRFLRLGQNQEAIETLRMGIEVLPGSEVLRENLRDVLLKVGDREGAVGEMITLAAISIDVGDVERAAAILNEVLLLVPGHYRAREMLSGLSFGGLEPIPDGTGAGAELATGDRTEGGLTYDEEGEPVQGEPHGAPPEHDYEADFDAVSLDTGEPLPSYDLEEVSADDALSHEPGRTALALSEQDDPFAEGAEVEAPEPELLPSFDLAEEDDPFTADPADAAELGVEHEPQLEPAYDADELGAEAADPYAIDEPDAFPEPELDASGTPMLATAARGFQGGDSLEDALEEVEFFSSRGLFDDAKAILDEQLARWPNHPLLLARLRELSEDEGAQPADEAPRPRSVSGSVAPPAEVSEDLLDASLDALDAFEPTQEAHSHFSREEEQVDVEAVFAKFKEGVKAQVDDSDSATHYDLGVAYKEMGLIQDALGEFRLAARDPHRACVCLSMVGMIELERGRLDPAADAFKEALATDEHTTEQELSLYYELGSIFETKRTNSEALYYYRKIQRKDPQFRDVADRIRALEPPPANGKAAAPKPMNTDEDFDSMFDDILGNEKLP